MGRKRSASRITRTVKRGKKPRGVRRGSRRGRYHTSRIKDPLAKPWLKPPVYASLQRGPSGDPGARPREGPVGSPVRQ